jgi:chromosome segregation ATPase
MSKRWILFLIALSVAGAAGAASDRKANREREALRRAQMQLQQTESKLGEVEREKARLGRELEEATKAQQAAREETAALGRELQRAREQGRAAGQELEGVRQSLATTREQLTDSQRQLAEAHRALAETRRTLEQTQGEARGLEAVKTRRERELALCEDNNRKLYELGRELMVLYERQGVGDVLARREPFTGLRQVEVENLMEAYRDKLDEQKLIKPPGG